MKLCLWGHKGTACHGSERILLPQVEEPQVFLILVCGLEPWYRKQVLVTSRLRLQSSPKDERFIIAILLLKTQIEFETADEKRKHWSVHRIRILCYPGSPIQFIRFPPRHYFWVLLKLIGKSWTKTSQIFFPESLTFCLSYPNPKPCILFKRSDTRSSSRRRVNCVNFSIFERVCDRGALHLSQALGLTTPKEGSLRNRISTFISNL